jgi:hypothetical protein
MLINLFILANHVNRAQLLQRNHLLASRVRALYLVVNRHYEEFVLNRFVFSFDGCVEERRLSSLRRDIELWLLDLRRN